MMWHGQPSACWYENLQYLPPCAAVELKCGRVWRRLKFGVSWATFHEISCRSQFGTKRAFHDAALQAANRANDEPGIAVFNKALRPKPPHK